MLKDNKGFTFIEIIVAALILAIAVAAVYAAFLSAARFSGTFRHEVMAVIAAQSDLENAISQHRYLFPGVGWPGGAPDPNNLPPCWDQLDSEVENLNPHWSLFQGPPYPYHPHEFRRMNVWVTWNEREI